MKRNTKRAYKYLIEFLIVAFGVFLGLYASELQNWKKINSEKEKSISYIIEELENNKNSLEESIKYHQSIKIEIDSIINTLDENDLYTNYIGNKSFQIYEIKGWNGVRISNLENTAFEAAKISGIVKEYDIKFIKNISKLYKHQETYSEFGNSVLNKMINVNSSSKVVDVVGLMELITNDLLNYEKAILDAIEKLKQE